MGMFRGAVQAAGLVAMLFLAGSAGGSWGAGVAGAPPEADGALGDHLLVAGMDFLTAVPTVAEYALQGVHYRDYLGHPEPRCGIYTGSTPAVKEAELKLPRNEPVKVRFVYRYFVTADHPVWPVTVLTFSFLANDSSWVNVGNNVVWVAETDVSPAPGPTLYHIVAYAIIQPGSGGLVLRPQARVTYDHPVTDFADCVAMGEAFVLRITPY